jgi:hypothetical protein
MSTKRVCLVTDEFYPCTAGGIGRVLHNLVAATLEAHPKFEFTLVVPEYCQIRRERLSEAMKSVVDVVVVKPRTNEAVWAERPMMYPSPNAFESNPWQGQSLDLMLALKSLEDAGTKFDVIEFPDYRGWAHCSLQEKRLGRAFSSTLLSVRIHTSDGVLQRFEPRALSLLQAELYEIERKALHDADLAIAHLEPVRVFNKETYSFDEEWQRNTTLEFPPVVWPLPNRVKPTAGKDLLFVTKLQNIKRPDLFVLGVTQFMRAVPQFTGDAVLMCHAFDAAYRQEILDLVPDDLSHRVKFIHRASEREREKRISQGIVVIPSEFESLNLAAYEIGSLGRPLILNGKCIAFGDGTPFLDGINCWKFDGTAGGLATVLERSWRAALPKAVDCSFERPYWERRITSRPTPRSETEPELSIIIRNRNRAARLPELLASIARTSHRAIEPIVIDDGSNTGAEEAFLNEAERRMTVIRMQRTDAAAARAAGLQASRGRFVMFVESTDIIDPDFVAKGVRALDAHPEFSGVVPALGIYDTVEDAAYSLFSSFLAFLGDAPSLALLGLRGGGRGTIYRRDAVLKMPATTHDSMAMDADLMLHLNARGARFLVSNAVGLLVLRGTAGVVERERIGLAQHLKWLARAYEELPPATSRAFRPFGLLALLNKLEVENHSLREAAQHLAPHVSPHIAAPPLIDRVNAAIKRAPALHGAMKRVLTFDEMDPGVPVRHQIVQVLGEKLRDVVAPNKNRRKKR